MDYKKHYNLLIEKAKNRNGLKGYKEKHHVIPKCMDGKDNIDNLVELTAREHYLAHWLLHKIYPENSKLVYAVHMMMIGRKDNLIISSGEYEKIKKIMSKLRKGKKLSEEHKQKISLGLKGRECSLETRELLSKAKKGEKHHMWGMFGEKNPFYGKTHKPESIEKVSKAKKEYFQDPENIKKNRLQKTCRPVEIDGVYYQSISDACRKLNMGNSKLRNRLNSPIFPNYKHLIKDEDYQYKKEYTPETREKLRNTKKCRKIEIDGVQYKSIADASRMLNILHGTIYQRLISKNFTNYKYL